MFGRKMDISWFVSFVATLCRILDYFLINCSSPRAKKDAVKYLNSKMDRFQTVPGFPDSNLD